jgi:preprotein translocase subunit SecG
MKKLSLIDRVLTKVPGSATFWARTTWILIGAVIVISVLSILH